VIEILSLSLAKSGVQVSNWAAAVYEKKAAAESSIKNRFIASFVYNSRSLRKTDAAHLVQQICFEDNKYVLTTH
jgi:hypothetical protein